MTWTDSQNGAPSKGKVLVVEDEIMIRMLLEDMLSDLGYTVAGAVGRIDEAVKLAKGGEFDLAILDVNLNGQTGQSGRRDPGRARAAVRVRHRLWRARTAGAFSRPPDPAEAVPAGEPEPHPHPGACQPPPSERARQSNRKMAGPPPGHFRIGSPDGSAQSNTCARRVMNGSSVMSSRSGVTAMRRSASAERSVPWSARARAARRTRSSNRDCRDRRGARSMRSHSWSRLPWARDGDALHLVRRAVGEIDVDQHVAAACPSASSRGSGRARSAPPSSQCGRCAARAP